MKIHHLFLTTATALICSITAPAQQPTGLLTIQQKLDQIIFPTVQFRGATIEEAVEYLRIKSRDLDQSNGPPASKGVSFVLKKDASAKTAISLDLTDVPLGVALGYCVDLADLKYRVDAHAVMIAASVEPKFTPPVLGNADTLIFPTVQFQGATLDEATEYFRAMSRTLGTTKKGVNILVKRGGESVKISLDLRNIPLSDSLGYVAELGQCKLTTDGHSYILTPQQAK